MEEGADRYPDLRATIEKVLADEFMPSEPIERFEVTLLPSGEATYRVWQARAEEPVGGYYGPA